MLMDHVVHPPSQARTDQLAYDNVHPVVDVSLPDGITHSIGDLDNVAATANEVDWRCYV
jgi:hypothetical protein